jgi:hypothetical protein
MALVWFLAGTAVGAGVCNLITMRAARDVVAPAPFDDEDQDDEPEGWPDEYYPGDYISDLSGATDN